MVNIFKIPPHNYTERESSVINILTENQKLELKSFLNVGFHNWEDIRRHWWIRICEENNIDWKILEVFEGNVNDALNKGCPADKIILGNILDVNNYPTIDCMLFWHGPEHINKEIFIKTLPEIENKVNKLIIFGMPLGFEPQDVVYDNKYEIHLSEWQPSDWELLGYKTIIVRDRMDFQHITAYKILRG